VVSVAIDARLVAGLRPGALSASAALQTAYYARHHGFGLHFEAGRLADIAEFIARYDAARDGVWLVLREDDVLGTLVIDGGGATPGWAQLRWFILADALRGRGFGRRMMQVAMDYCRPRFEGVFLTTFAGLDPARRLYEAFGFRLTQEARSTTWGPEVTEQRFEWRR
jgi:GNAT superfamily N-acetyltransferase